MLVCIYHRTQYFECLLLNLLFRVSLWLFFLTEVLGAANVQSTESLNCKHLKTQKHELKLSCFMR